VSKARPITGAVLGVVIGLATAVVLQQQGVWPLDKLTLFLLPALTGLIGVAVTRIGRRPAPLALAIALLLLIPLAAWGATGIADMNETGIINGGCTVAVQSTLDETVVTDTSRGDPFLVDPDGGLSWQATSPEAFTDYDFEIWIEVGGYHWILESGHEVNENQDTENTGEIANVTDYAESFGVLADQLRGIVKVGGAAATCDGFGFVEVQATFLETLTAKIAALVGVLALVILLLVAFTGRTRPVEVDSGAAEGAGPEPPPAAGTEPPPVAATDPPPASAGEPEAGPASGEPETGRSDEVEPPL
jgi:hypothetical protein